MSNPTGRPKKSANIDCVCAHCGKEYTVPDWQRSNRKYCSRECYLAAPNRIARPARRIEPLMKVCPQCGKEFPTGGRGRPRMSQVYCSNACQGLAHGHQAIPRVLSEPEAAWLAGLFDGEGSIVFPRKGSTNPRLSITNTHYPLLEKVVEVTGTGSIIEMTRYHKNPLHSPSWNWLVYSTNARNVLRQMLPWLIVKREKALIALGEHDPISGGTLVVRHEIEGVTLRNGESTSFTATVPLT